MNNILRFVPRFTVAPNDAAWIHVVLRIVLGVVLIYREAFVAVSVGYLPDFVTYAWGGLLRPELFVVLGLLLILGIADRWVFAFLAVSYVEFNLGTKRMNLGPLLMIPLFALGAINAASQKFSLGESIRRRLPRLTKGFPFPIALSVDGFSTALTWVFFCYALNSFCAVLFHLQDESWLHGETVWKIFTNNYLCRYFEFFRSIESRIGSRIPLFCSAAALIVQTIFQLFMWPLACGRPGSWPRLFVMLQGYAFFTASWAFIQLSILPPIEILTWTIVFWGDLSTLIRRPLSESGSSMVTSIPAPNGRQLLPLGAVMFAVAAFTITDLSAYLLGSEFTGRAIPIRNGLIYCGIWPPNVLNKIDLKMGESWLVLYEGEPDKMRRVPVFHEDGARDRYHYSDLVYYGMTLPWRRTAVLVDEWDQAPESMRHTMELLARYHAGHTEDDGKSRQFYYKVVRDDSMNLELPPAERYRRNVLCEGRFEILRR